jgi:hypothetical protein
MPIHHPDYVVYEKHGAWSSPTTNNSPTDHSKANPTLPRGDFRPQMPAGGMRPESGRS